MRARTLTYGDGTTWPWWVHVEPLHDTHRTPDADQRYQLTLSDGAMDVAHGDGWEGQPGDADGFTHADCLAAAWRLNAAIVSAPPEPEPVEWVDGRADVGDARLLAAWSPANGRTLVIDITHRGTLQTVRHRDEATAKRLAVAVARAMSEPT